MWIFAEESAEMSSPGDSALDKSANDPTNTNEKITALRRRLSEFLKGLEERSRQTEERLGLKLNIITHSIKEMVDFSKISSY